MSTEPTTKKRTFAKLFTSEKYGDILVVADTDDEGGPCIRIMVDTHPGALNPSSVTLTFRDGCQFEKLKKITQERAEEIAKGVYERVEPFAVTCE